MVESSLYGRNSSRANGSILTKLLINNFPVLSKKTATKQSQTKIDLIVAVVFTLVRCGRILLMIVYAMYIRTLFSFKIFQSININ